jgi:hypothetical protein
MRLRRANPAIEKRDASDLQGEQRSGRGWNGRCATSRPYTVACKEKEKGEKKGGEICWTIAVAIPRVDVLVIFVFFFFLLLVAPRLRTIFHFAHALKLNTCVYLKKEMDDALMESLAIRARKWCTNIEGMEIGW